VDSLQWMDNIRSSLATLQPGDVDSATGEFFTNYYQVNFPTVFKLKQWPALNWNVDTLRRKIGNPLVEVQTNRLADVQYEINSLSHKATLPFQSFVDEMLNGPNNNIYMTAQNRSTNSAALQPLWEDVGVLPACLHQQPDAGFVWLGRDTVTPLHHDETNNLMCQVMGVKQIRLFSPDQRERLQPDLGVHSRLNWVTDAMVAERRLVVYDVWLSPGAALFLPIGWWHCVRAVGVAMTIVYTNFIWRNFWNRVTD
jgi:Cupin-like domain